MFRPILYKITGFVVPNFVHFINKSWKFIVFNKIHLQSMFKQLY